MGLFNLIIILVIVFFIFLLSYQIFLEFFKNKTIEGLKTQYSAYNTDNPDNALILSQKNAGNIESLKEQLDDLSQVKPRVDDLKQQVDLLNTQIQDLVKQQAVFAQQIAGDTPPEVTGTS